MLPATIAISLMKIVEEGNIGAQEPATSFTDGKLSLTIPFYVNNTGFYDITDIDVYMDLCRKNKKISTASAQLPDVPAGRKTDLSVNFSVSLEQLFLEDSELLTVDTELDVNASVHLRVAYAIAFKASMIFGAPWGAPFHNLTVYDVNYDSSKQVFSFFISFDNHAQYPINGALKTELYNSTNMLIGSAAQLVEVPSQACSQTYFATDISSTEITPNVIIRIYFENVKISETEWAL